jgi:hypothetical protein
MEAGTPVNLTSSGRDKKLKVTDIERHLFKFNLFNPVKEPEKPGQGFANHILVLLREFFFRHLTRPYFFYPVSPG